MPIRITCPKCRHELTAEDEQAGANARCPTCGTPFAVPARHGQSFKGVPLFAETNPVGPAGQVGDERQCPYCSEPIKRSAIKCKHCGEFLDGRQRGAIEARPSSEVNRGIAAVLSLVIPGAGQMYRGHVVRGLVWLVCVYAGYIALFFPGLMLHVICVVMAAAREE